MAAYFGDCGSLTEANAVQGNVGDNTITMSMNPSLSGTSDIMYLRIASVEAGDFRIIFSANS